jgi:hypothetical protein
MWFPVALSASPVHEAFSDISIDSLTSLSLTAPEKALFKSGEENVVGYTLFDHNDAFDYVQLLLKIMEYISSPSSTHGLSVYQRVSALSLDRYLPRDEAVEYVNSDMQGVLLHYTVSAMCDVVLYLRENAKSTKTTKSSISGIFYPDGILIEQWRPLWKTLRNNNHDDFSQRKFAGDEDVTALLYCLLLLTHFRANLS